MTAPGHPQMFERVVDESVEDATQQRNYVGVGAMICEPCNIALVAPQTSYITSVTCPRCGGGLKLRTLL